MNRLATEDINENIQWHIKQGCIDYTDRFGAIAVPVGYSILLNSDYSHFFYVRHSDDSESSEHWDRFAVLKWVKRDLNLIEGNTVNKEKLQKFIEENLEFGVNDDGDVYLSGVNCDLTGNLSGNIRGNLNGDHYGDLNGDHYGQRITK
tara:strand:- start:27982 stop:28425 length:444 start_codon:yes stop_codon:yes gene_type:complete